MSIDSIGSSSGFDPTLMASKMAQKIVSEFDANEDGSIDKQEFSDALQTKGISQEDAEKIFDSMDESSTGKITQSDIENAINNMAAAGMPPEGMGAPPPPPPPDEAEESEDSASNSDDDNTTYEKADKNKDGEVTVQEQWEYILTHPDSQSLNLSGSSSSVIDVTA